MSTIFTRGQTVWTDVSHQPCEIVSVLGEGGQGAVYQVSLDGRPAAMKWYHPQFATGEQKAGLETLVRKGPPTGKFLWPIELVSKQGSAGFGYLMPLRDARYRGIADLMKRRIDPTFRALATAGFELAHSFLQLHSKGFCYRDISFGNVFFDPESGEILICDNDNVAIDGATKGGILERRASWRRKWCAATRSPASRPDFYSLAVLLFYIFVVHHPLEGQKELAIHSFDLPAMTMLYGTEPIFIYDPNVTSNRPVQGIHDNALFFWPIYPQFLRDLFIKSFTEGIRDSAHGRIREGEWRAAMVRLRDSIHYCHHCSAENFFHSRAREIPAVVPEFVGIATSTSGRHCGFVWANTSSCLTTTPRSSRTTSMIQSPYDFTRPIGAVTRHPQNPDVWGLKNLSATKWSSRTAADPVPADVPPGMSVTLQAGTMINFGKVEGQIII